MTTNLQNPELLTIVQAIYHERFGVPLSLLNQYNYFQRKDMIWMSSLPTDYRQHFRGFQMQGIRIIRYSRHIQKPTTAGLQFWAPYLRQHVLIIDDPHLMAQLLQRGKLPAEIDSRLNATLTAWTPGYVALAWRRTQTLILGCAQWKPPYLTHHIPRRRLPELLNAIELQGIASSVEPTSKPTTHDQHQSNNTITPTTPPCCPAP